MLYSIVNNFMKKGKLIKKENALVNLERKRYDLLILLVHNNLYPACREKVKKEIDQVKTSLKCILSILEKIFKKDFYNECRNVLIWN
ncbi:hypothetical protein SAMN02745975_03109 [Geosporobacter subterraneus DSM 17957]|uniref:Uncharacterized protein n=1 Tax=Geosporobacter subterraneus DSM 17957 TaxID=1121919 RepID=A0A1M6MVY1_9FIRM|nr:hypothetical protein SAMN02745975_03109 [Geosporobacter subterraneus DSM 17957]